MPFLTGGGEMGGRIAGFDWAATSIGPLARWPGSLRNTVSLMLRSAVPLVLLWGQDGVMIYNDAYAEFAGGRDSRLLGSKVREGWNEVADFNDNVMKVGLAGGTLSYKGHELTLYRNGRPEQVWMDLDYSPVLDEAGQPAGVLAIVVETTETQRNRHALERSEAELRRSQEAGGVGLFSIDVASELIACTPAFCRIFGLPPQDSIASRKVEALIHADDASVLSDTRRHRGAVLEVEYRIRRADTGDERLIACKGEYERDEAGKVQRLVGAVQDVTERRRVQLALERSEAGFSALAQNMPMQVWTAAADGPLDWFNSRVYDYCGAGEGALDDQGWARMIHPDDLSRTRGRWLAALGQGDTYETEFRLRNAAGEYRWHLTRAVPLRDSRGAVTSWIGTNTDIHEQKLLEVASTRDRDRLWSISQDLLLVCDYAGQITAINPSARRLLGWRESEMVGHLLMDFVHPDDIERTVAEVKRVAGGHAALTFENRYRHKSGAYRLFAWTAVPDGGRIHGVGRDITDERATEEALRQSQKMEAVGQLTGGIAHDFNNLLQGITGSLDIAERRLANGQPDEVAPWLAAAKSSADRAAALTHRLLAFSRRQPIDPRPVQANPLLSSMESLLLRTLGEGVACTLQLDGALWTTRCDPHQLESAILNLAINARDAMPQGGALSIATGNVHLERDTGSRPYDIAPGDYVCITVADTGAGMTKEVLEHALEPFFTTKAIGQGTGLGLSMVYGFARQAEGFIDIASQPGQGACVKLYLPRFLGEAKADPPAGEAPETPLAISSEVVLVVEDEPIVRMLIVDVLEELGYQALEAGDGVKGLELLRSPARIDLLISDIGLPGLDGRQMAEAGRVDRPDLKVLFMTGYAANAAQASGFLAPGMALISKPFAVDALAAKIREVIEG